MTAYYNEIDPEAAAWLRELISAGMLPAGDVDERSIVDVSPDDLRPYTQCHFFAGIGGWPAALKWLAGWPDDRPVWTGSCPCQPFSAAGKGAGFDDERHLWPFWFHLIRVCRPRQVYGEQVANALEWLDLVQNDLEGEGYAVGAADLCAAGVSAPHIRQRLFWGAYDLGHPANGLDHAQRARLEGHDRNGGGDRGRSDAPGPDAASGGDHGMGHTHGTPATDTVPTGREVDGSRSRGSSGGLAHTDGTKSELAARERTGSDGPEGTGPYRELDGCGELRKGRVGTSPIGGWWGGADWLLGRDGKFRPVETGTFPLGDGIPHRVGLLRGYGNAIVPQVAAEFVKAFEESK